MNQTEFICYLQGIVTGVGSQRKTAHQLGISESYLSDVLNHRRAPGKKILNALGFTKVSRYLRGTIQDSNKP